MAASFCGAYIAYKKTPDEFLSEFEPKMERLLSLIRKRTCTLNELAIQCGFTSYRQYLFHRSIYVSLNSIS